MSSLSMESMGSEAAAVRIYRRSGAEFTEVAKLSPITLPHVVEGSVEVPEIDMEHGGSRGLYLALVQGGRVVDMAQMLFYGGDSGNDDGGSDCYSECYSTDLSTCGGSSSRSSSDVNEGGKHMFGLMGCEEDEEEEEEETTSSQEESMSTNSDESVGRENNGGFFRSIFWQQVNDDLGSGDDDEDREKNTSSEEEELKKVEKGLKEDEQTVQMKLRLWPLQKHVLTKIFRGSKWILTKDYCLFWLKFEEINELDLEVDYDGSRIFRESAVVMDFEITVRVTPSVPKYRASSVPVLQL